MNSIGLRLASFRDWPKEDVVTRRSLADAGLFYSGHDDEVTCFECKSALSGWDEQDDPVMCHTLFCPGCSFIASEYPEALRVTFDDEESRFATFPRHWCCGCGANDTDCATGCSRFLAREGFFHCADQQICCLSCLARFDLQSRHDNPWLVHADASHVCRALLDDVPPPLLRKLQTNADARMATFRAGWPAGDAVHPQAMVDAGLFYSLEGDTVCCAFCRKAIRSWEEGDEPWDEHARLHPTCPLVRTHVQYSDIAARRASYSDDCDMLFTPDSLAAAGFFHRREDDGDDAVQCFQCLLRVSEWLDDDCPWTRHARLSPLCSQVLRLAPVCVLSERFCLRSARVASFTASYRHASAGIGAEAFADCGFFYCATGDAVRCFNCGLVLRSWEQDDSVWLEHWRHSRECALVRMCPPSSPAWLAVCVASSISEQDLTQIVAASSMTTVRSALEAWPLRGAALTANSLHEQVLAMSTLAAAPRLALPVAGASAPTLLDLDNSVEPPAKRDYTGRSSGDRLSCKVCMDKEVGVAFQPCGHMNCCQECSEQVRLCPLCRAAITDRFRVFL